MKYKKILIVAFILLAILTIGAVSASGDADVIAQGYDETVSDDNVVDEISGVEDLSLLGDDSGNAETTLTAEDINTKYNSGEGIIVNLTDANGYGVVDVPIIAVFDDFTETVYTNESGLADISLRGLKPGYYTPLIKFEGYDYYNPSSTFANVVITKTDCNITALDIETPYNSGEGFMVYLADEYGNPIYDALIYTTFDNITEITYTDELGWTNVSVKGLKPGNYTPLIKFEGDDYYNPSIAVANVVITKTSCNITALDILTPYNSGDGFLVYLVDEYGYPIYDASIVSVFDDFTEIAYTDELGWANVSVKGLKPGAYKPLVKFEGDDYYNPSNTTVNIIITKTDSHMDVFDITAQYNCGEDGPVYLFDAYGYPIYNATLIVVIDDVMQTVYTDETGWAYISLKGLKPDSYPSLVVFVGNDYYNPSNETFFIEIIKANTKITTNYTNGTLSAFLTDDYGNPISGAKVGFANNGVTYSLTDEKGEARYSTKDLPEGTYTVRVKYFGDDNYNPSNQAVTEIVVTKITTELSSADVTVRYHDEDAYLLATLKDGDGNPVSGVKVGFANNGVTYVYTDENGEARYYTGNLDEGTYNVKMKFYGDDTYGSSNQATAKITVTRVSTNLTSSDVYALYHEDAYLVATLKDADGNPVSGVKVGFANNGVTYVYTDENGEARYYTGNLDEGTYNVKMKFYGDDAYGASNQATAKIVIGKIATSLNASDVQVRYNAEGYLVATLKDANGKAIVGAKVGFANNGVTYVYTDENGEAKYSTLGLNNGTYTVKIKYYGNDTYQESNQASAKIYVVDKISTSLTSSDVHVLYDEDGYLVATLKDANGKAIVGAKVGFANNGVTYVYTDENGEAKYSTKGLAEGTYDVRIKFYGNDAYQESNQARAKIYVGKYMTPSLTSNGVTTTYGADDYLVATLTGMNNKPITGAKILFTVFGKKIVDITDSSGHAKISTKGYNPGIYNVLFKFAGNSMYSEASSTAKMTINRS